MMLFKPEHVHLILEGKKTQTRRRWKKPRVRVGAIYQARTTLFGKPFAHLLIKSRYQERLGDMPYDNCWKEGYSTMAHYMDKWVEINGSWNPNETVWVVNYELVSKGDNDK